MLFLFLLRWRLAEQSHGRTAGHLVSVENPIVKIHHEVAATVPSVYHGHCVNGLPHGVVSLALCGGEMYFFGNKK